jgi:hypothetical protein
MTAAICPYCRAPIEPNSGDELVCPGCGAPHHADCYKENGGCTVFGCTAAPAEEPKVQLTGSDLGMLPRIVSAPVGAPGSNLALPVAPAPAPVPIRTPAPPPPTPGTAASTAVNSVPLPRFGSGSVLFGAQPVAAVATAAPAADLCFEPDAEAKNRMTFIILGVLLGPFGAHNFYAGYTGKGIAQLCITVLTLGLGSPMSWAWAVIDVWTVDRDQRGVKFRS